MVTRGVLGIDVGGRRELGFLAGACQVVEEVGEVEEEHIRHRAKM